MVDRWSVERAVRDPACTLDPPGRQLVLTLLTWSDHDTAMIPERFTPSLTDLVNATGLARSTVAAWLNKLETFGWVVRARPTVAAARSRKARTVYSLRVPTGPSLGPAESSPGPGDGPAGSESPRSGGPAGGPDKSGTGPAVGPELVRQADGTGPPSGLSPYREPALTVGGRARGPDHRYIEGPNGTCARRGCRKSAPLHPVA